VVVAAEKGPVPDIEMFPWPGPKASDSIRAECLVEALQEVENIKRELGDDAPGVPAFFVDGDCLVLAVMNEDGTTSVIEATVKFAGVTGIKLPT
jgi:hypothetical protein